VTAFPKWHDAADPQSFVVDCQGIRIGVFTDIGAPCEEVLRHFGSCHAAYLEANYDEKLLEEGSYPAFLKSRIRGGHGHLSNQQALALFRVGKPAFMSHLFLAHLSQQNNCPQLVGQLFSEYAGQTEIIVASRFQETALYRIGHEVHVRQREPVPSTAQADCV
jgi:phosphoribosyl 1,2-cyclic phosphodiesterase